MLISIDSIIENFDWLRPDDAPVLLRHDGERQFDRNGRVIIQVAIENMLFLCRHQLTDSVSLVKKFISESLGRYGVLILTDKNMQNIVWTSAYLAGRAQNKKLDWYYFNVTNFRGNQISRISQFRGSSAKLNSREISQNQFLMLLLVIYSKFMLKTKKNRAYKALSAKLNSRENEKFAFPFAKLN